MSTKTQNQSGNAADIQTIMAEISANLTAAAGKAGILIGYVQFLEAQNSLLCEKLEEQGVNVREVMKELPNQRPSGSGK